MSYNFRLETEQPCPSSVIVTIISKTTLNQQICMISWQNSTLKSTPISFIMLSRSIRQDSIPKLKRLLSKSKTLTMPTVSCNFKSLFNMNLRKSHMLNLSFHKCPLIPPKWWSLKPVYYSKRKSTRKLGKSSKMQWTWLDTNAILLTTSHFVTTSWSS